MGSLLLMQNKDMDKFVRKVNADIHGGGQAWVLYDSHTLTLFSYSQGITALIKLNKMSKIIIFLIVSFIKIYKYMISPILGNRCRYMPTCSEYFQEALEVHGLIKGLRLSVKRILSCHPIKYLGGS